MALSIFIINTLLMFFQPFKINYAIYTFIMAMLCFVFGLVSFGDFKDIISVSATSSIAFVGLIGFTLILDDLGFFAFIAYKILKYCKNSLFKIYILLLIFTSILSAIFANDGAILALTPILIHLCKKLEFPFRVTLAFMLSVSFMADSASLALVNSNLTNILSSHYFNISFVKFSERMFFSNLMAIFASIIFSYFYFKKSLVKLDFQNLKEEKFKNIFYLCFFLIFIMIIGFLIISNVAIVILSVMLCLYFVAVFQGLNNAKILRSIPYNIILFSLSLYVIIFALKNAGSIEYIAHIIIKITNYNHTLGIFTTSFFTAILSSVINNVPANLLMNIAINSTDFKELVYANLIGSNLGTKLSPFGSLATLLWLHLLKKNDITIPLKEFLKFGFSISFIIIFLTTLVYVIS